MARKKNYPTVAELSPDATAVADLPAKPLVAVPNSEPPIDPIPEVALPVAFERSLVKVLRHEGGFVNHPRDPGGATNLGISLRYARGRGSLFDLDGDGDVDVDDIRLITVATAAPAYHQDFWLTVRADEIPAGLSHAVFDAAVNSGPARAIRWLQAAVHVTQDGLFGPKTLAAVRGVNDAASVAAAVCEVRLAYLRTLNTWNTFGGGWQSRVSRVVDEAKRLAGRA